MRSLLAQTARRSVGASSCRRFPLRASVRFAQSSAEWSEFPGAASEFTNELKFRKHEEPFKCFSVMGPDGEMKDPSFKTELSDETLVKMYKTMVMITKFDEVFYNAQRQGRVSFYMTSNGEEATQIGSASALEDEDWIFAQYREMGVLMWRGYELLDFANQLFANEKDHGKGRQLGVHYGSAKLNYVTISSPLTTQLPQAVGTAYALKREDAANGRGPETGKGRATVCYFGEGAASEGDFHAAFNMAATLECPIVFFCRNNGFAISTSTADQYAGDGIAARGPGYGIPTIRVDGNDWLAVHKATKEARERALKESRPYLVEAMTYRISHHSTSDDSARYRELDEINYWNSRSPIGASKKYLEARGLWDDERDAEYQKECRQAVLECMATAEKEQLAPLTELFTDVYEELPAHIREQQEELNAHLEKYADQHEMLKRMAPADTWKPKGRTD